MIKRLLLAHFILLQVVVSVLAGETNNVAAIMRMLDMLPIPAMSFQVPAFMTVTNKFNTRMAASTDGTSFMVQVSPTNFLSFLAARDIFIHGFQAGVSGSHRIQEAHQKPHRRVILGASRSGTLVSDVYNGSPRTTEYYIFLYEDCTVALLMQHFDSNEGIAREAFQSMLESLQMAK